MVGTVGNSNNEPVYDTVRQGDVSNLHLKANTTNFIEIAVKDNILYLFINGEHIETIEITEIRQKGNIVLATGIDGQDVVNGEQTKFENVNIWS